MWLVVDPGRIPTGEVIKACPFPEWMLYFITVGNIAESNKARLACHIHAQEAVNILVVADSRERAEMRTPSSAVATFSCRPSSRVASITTVAHVQVVIDSFKVYSGIRSIGLGGVGWGNG